MIHNSIAILPEQQYLNGPFKQSVGVSVSRSANVNAKIGAKPICYTALALTLTLML